MSRIDRWLRREPDGTVTVLTGKVEIGQGITTALAQIVADELGMPVSRVRVAPVDTDVSPDEGVTSGSRSIEESGVTLQRVAAEARRATLEGDPDPFAREVRGDGAPRPASERTVLGRHVPRADVLAKVTGAPSYVQDLRLPGMVHARVVRPPAYDAALVALDEAALRALPGVVAVVRDGSFAAVAAEREEQAIRALMEARRIAGWEAKPSLPATTDPRFLLSEPSEEIVVEDGTVTGDRTHGAEYSRPFIAHAAIAPSCAVALLDGGRYTVWSHTQGPHQLKHEIAKILRVDPAAVRVIHMEGAGCYGHNGADDAGVDAALVARALPGRPVRLQWMRDDEFAWEPYGTAMVVRLSARLDGERIADWSHELWGHGHGNRPNPSLPKEVSTSIAARHLARSFTAAVAPRPRSNLSGGQRNAVPYYDIPAKRVVNHYVPKAALRVSSLRSLGAHANVFAIESFMDELAERAGADPLEFRLRHLTDPRAREALTTACAMADWRAGERGNGTRGRGMAFARYKNNAVYAAMVAEVELRDVLAVTRVWAAVDAGLAVSPDGVVNQTEGGIVQAVSWTLKEAVRFDRERVTSRGWEDYPILTFSETPEVEVRLIQRETEPPLGVGEGLAGPVSAAIANAVANASGLRLRDMPFTRERIVAALG
ncbi:MAG TPA: molybdopterin cofactor-binding domain-containing protein [Candidatus Limnocylindria bacterium]|nr:molybdopterin cofactor-binding domain-containing protein [Candidatus Limnocylindria bacterium]